MRSAGAGAVRRRLALGVVVVLLGGLSVSDGGATTTPEAPLPVASPSRTAPHPDFNGDGFADLAVAAEIWPDSDEVTTYPGVVLVLYGSVGGLTRTGMQTWTAADFVAGDADELFGEALGVGDFDGDGYADLAIGSAELPYGDVGQGNHGRVRIVYGSATGLTRERSQLWSQNSPGIRGAAEGEDGFGSVLVAADFGRGDQDDLAIGVGGENGNSGAVAVLYGSTTGLVAAGNQLWTQASPGVPGKRERVRGKARKSGRTWEQEMFGLALAADTFAGGAYADLAIGVPGDRVGGREEAGSVNVLYGSAAGLTSRGAQLWSQRTAGIKGTAEAVDWFGASLAAGHFAGRSTADLAIGVPGENGYRGALNVLYGAAGGLTATGDQIWSRRTKGLGDRRRLDIDLGTTMTAADLGHDAGGRRYDDLVASAYDQHKGWDLVEVVYGSAGGLSTTHSRAWDLNSPGIQGEMVSNGTSFGSSLAAGNFDGDRVGLDELVIGDDQYDGGLFVIIKSTPEGLTARGNRLWTVEDFRQPGLTYLGQSLAAG